MTEQMTPVGQEELVSLVPDAREAIERFQRDFDLSIYHVEGGVWNQNDDDLKGRTGNVGIYVVRGQNYKDDKGNTITPQRFYKVEISGRTKIEDDEFVSGPDGKFLGYPGHKRESRAINVAATLARNDQGKVTGLSFVRISPKGESL